MKSTIIITLIAFISFFVVNDLYSQTSQKRNEKSFLSPESLEKFQNEELPTDERDSKTFRNMYRNVNFIDFRGLELTTVAHSGFSGEKENFESLTGYNLGMTWEFPILSRKLGGDTPILKARMGKTEIKSSDELSSNVKVSSSSDKFVESLGVSEIYTIGFGAGYCYHVGFDCVYAMYNTYLTGQLTTVEDDGAISTVPTQLKGMSLGMTSSFETFLGLELTLGMEYSILTHSTPISDDQNINTFAIVFGLGFLEQSRYLNMQKIEYTE